MTVNLPKSATWIIWPVALAFACTLTFAWGWVDGIEQGRQRAAREAERPASSCCSAPVRVAGKTTNYYTCSKCGKSCDIKEEK